MEMGDAFGLSIQNYYEFDLKKCVTEREETKNMEIFVILKNYFELNFFDLVNIQSIQ